MKGGTKREVVLKFDVFALLYFLPCLRGSGGTKESVALRFSERKGELVVINSLFIAKEFLF